MSEDDPKKPKRKYQYSSAQRAAIAERTAERALKKKQARAEKAKATKERKRVAKAEAAEQEAADAKVKAKAARKLSKQISGKPPKREGNVSTQDQIDVAGADIKEMVDEDQVEVIFRPNPGPQTDFLAAAETEVLYGGAAGGGKSYAMLIDPLRYAHRPAHRALLLRKSMPELIELIDLSRQLYPKAFPGTKFREVEKRWMFPSGATIQFSFVDTDQDVHRFQGQAFSWIGIDEITHYATPYVWDYLRSRLRRTDMEITPYMRCTANPGGLGGWWVKKMFVDPAEWNSPFWAVDIETDEILVYPDAEFLEDELKHLAGQPTFKRRFIPAKLTDNPHLMKSHEYLSMLASLPVTQRKRLLEGDWDVADSSAFPEFHRSTHVVEQFVPPMDWPRFRACDYGFVAPTAVVWFTIDYDGTIYVYRELYEKGLNAEQLANKIHAIEEDEPPGIIGILDSESWARRGQLGPSIAQVMINLGVKWQKADKGPGSRVNGKVELHRLLAENEETGLPGVLITEACQNLIRVMPMLPVDKNNPEDVDTKFAEDHLYDAFRYGCTSRLVRAPRYALTQSFFKDDNTFKPADNVFGY